MRGAWLSLIGAAALALAAHGQTGPAPDATFVVDFTNPGVSPSHWILTLHPDGSGHYRAERGNPPNPSEGMDVPNEDRDIRLSADYAEHVFKTAKDHKWFNEKCESRLKVAFQGWKKFSYTGPDGQGSCTFNYSQDREIQALGDSLMGVAETLREGARLEMLLQHDRLGLDREMEYISDGAKDGRIVQIGAIREILERLAGDDEVLERVRKRAQVLLAHAGT
jgi:hypothetical protein